MTRPFKWVQDHIVNLANLEPDTTAQDTYFRWDSRKPVCIVGHVLNLCGVKPSLDSDNLPILITRDGRVLGKAGIAASEIPWEMLDIEAPTEEQSRWVQTVQTEQDFGETWGYALAEAGPL